MTTPLRRQESALFDLSGSAKLRITGSDRLRFLNGQITNDVRKATESKAIEACILNAKGKMNGHVFISAGADCFRADVDPELRQVLAARLERYIIADDVQIEDITDRWALFHVLAPAAPGLEAACRVLSVHRFAESGWDIWIDRGQSLNSGTVLRELSAAFPLLDAEGAEVFRIEQGIPRWGRELTEEIIPIEANLEERTIDYEKGCYIGQEVISRMKMSGQTNKRLCGLVSLDHAPLSPGMKLVASVEKGREAGWITSATRSERLGKEIALGYVKRGFNNIGVKLDAFASEDADVAKAVPVEVVQLPFV
jgi:tRNA-modifying protein YgfZ